MSALGQLVFKFNETAVKEFLREEIEQEYEIAKIKKETDNESTRHFVLRIFNIIFVRLSFLAFSCFIIALSICLSKDYKFLILIIPVLTIIAETIFICVKRKGKDFDW